MKDHDITRFHWIPKDELLLHVKKSVSDFMSVFANLELDHEHPPAHPADLDPAVTAVVGFSGAYNGIVWARCSEALAVRIASGMWGKSPNGVDNHVLAAVGEMVNIFGEDVKVFLSPRLPNVKISIPSVFKHDDCCREFICGDDNLSCSFVHEGERLLVGMTVKKSLPGIESF